MEVINLGLPQETINQISGDHKLQEKWWD